MGVVSCYRLLLVRSFVLEAQSWSGNYVPVNLYQVNAILCSDKKGWGPQAQLSPSEVQILAKRRQISADGSLKARSPDSVQLPWLRKLGTQDSPQVLQATWTAGAGFCRL